MNRVELPRTIAMALLQQALNAGDKEICGLVGAGTDGALRVIPVRNAAREPERRFDMDARELIDAMKQLRERGERLFAIYHSHPHSAPEPSDTDIAELAHPEVLHLIVSLEIRGVLQLRGWRIKGSAAEAVDVGIAEEA